MDVLVSRTNILLHLIILYMESINKKVVVLFIHYYIWCSFGERYQFLWCSSEPDEVLMMHFVGVALRRSRVRRKFFVFRQIYQFHLAMLFYLALV